MQTEGRRPSSAPLRRSATYHSVARILSLFSFDPRDLGTAADARQEGGDRDLRIGSGPDSSAAHPDESTGIDPSADDDLLFADEVPEFQSPEDEIGLLELQKELRDCIHGGESKDARNEREGDGGREAEARFVQGGRPTDGDASTSGSGITGLRQGEGDHDGSVDLAYMDSEGAAEEQMRYPMENGAEDGSGTGDSKGIDTEMQVDGCMIYRDAEPNKPKEHENLVICNTSLMNSMSKQLDKGRSDQKAAILGAQDGNFSSLDEACSATLSHSLAPNNADSIQKNPGIAGDRADPATGIEHVGSKESTEVEVVGSLDVGEEGEIEEGEIMNGSGGSDTPVTRGESSDAEVDEIQEDPTSCQKLPVSVSVGGASVSDRWKVERPVSRFGERKLLDYCELDLSKDGPVDDNSNRRETVGAKMKSKYPEEDAEDELDKSLDPSERKRSKSKLQDVEVSDKKKRVMTGERKAKKKIAKKRKRAEINKKLGVKRLKIKPVSMPKKVVPCNFYLNGRCHQGASCKFSHDLVPLTKSQPCKYFACNSCLKGDDCPFDHELGKYSCHNFTSKGFCSRGDSCKFSHKLAAKEDSDTVGKQQTSSIAEMIGSSTHLKTNASSQASAKGLTSRAVAEPLGPVNKSIVAEKRTPLKAPKGIRFLSFDENATGSLGQPLNALQNQVGSSVLSRSSKTTAMPVPACSPISNLGRSIDRIVCATKSTQKAFFTGEVKPFSQGCLMDRSAEKVQDNIVRKPPLPSSAAANVQSRISEETSRLLDEFLFHGTV